MSADEAADVIEPRQALGAISSPELDEWMLAQRWFGAKARELGRDRRSSTRSR